MEKKEQVVYVKDLLFTALYRWRSIIVTALVFAVLLGGFTAFSGIQDMKNGPGEQVIPADQEAKMAAVEQQITLLEAQIAAQQLYLEESPLMQLDSTAVYTANLDIFVKSNDEEDGAPELVYGYLSALTGTGMAEQISGVLEIPEEYAQELVSVSKVVDTDRIVNVKIYSDSLENATKLLDVVDSLVQQAKVQVTDTLGDHEVGVVRGNVVFGKDSMLNDLQIAAVGSLNTALDSLTAQKKQLSTFSVADPQSTTMGSVIKSAIIFAVIGAIAGGGIAACFAWFRHLAGSKVYSARTLKNRTGLTILTCIPSGKKLCAVDKFLRKAEGRYLDEAQTAIAAATVSTYCGSNHKLMIVGNGNQDTWDGILRELEGTGLRVYCAGSLLKNPDAIKQLPNFDSILLIEQCGHSSYTDISKTISVIQDLNKQLIGCVLVDG